MRKATVFGAVIVIAAAALVLTPLLRGSAITVSAQTQQTAQVERTTLTTSIESSGTIAAEQTIYLSFGASGTVKSVDAEVGDEVPAGQALATLDTSDLEYQIALKEQALVVQQTAYDALVAPVTDEEIAQAEANLASAQSQLASAQASRDQAPNQETINCSDVANAGLTLENAQEDYNDYVKDGYEWDATFVPDVDSAEGEALRDAQQAFDIEQAQCSNTTSVSQYDMEVAAAQSSLDQRQAALDSLLNGPTQEDIDAAKAKLQQAQLELDNAKADLADAEVIAPFAGVVAAVDLVVGQSVTSNSNVITLVDTSKLHLNVAVDEVDIPQVEIGQAALVTSDALGSGSLDGLVSRIAPIGTDNDGVVTYDVRIDLPEAANAPIRVGMTTDVEIMVGSQQGVLVVPTEAIQRTGSNEFIQLVGANGTPTDVPVITGLTSDGKTVIEGSNISEGAQVIIPASTGNQASTGPFGGG